MDIQRLELEGVPVIWAPGPGPMTGCIMFRVGQNDEHLTTRGTTHLLEHLALAELDVPYGYNGATGPSTTSFYARGSSEEVGHFLNQVIFNLSNLPWQRARTEAAVLKAEAASRSDSAFALASYLRFGPSHAGLYHLPELGLENPEPEMLDGWRHHFFNKQNCAIWFSGPQPPVVDLSPLPQGERRTALEPSSIRPAIPHWSFQPMSGISGFAFVERSLPAALASFAISRRLTERLRGELGIAYGANASNSWMSAKSGMFSLGIDCAPENSGKVYTETTIEISRLAYGDLKGDEIERYISQSERAFADPASASGIASMNCEDALFGRPLRTLQDIIAETRTVTPDQVGAAMEEFALGALWVLPQGIEIGDARPRAISAWTTDKLADAKKFSPENRKDKATRDSRLHVSPEGVMFEAGLSGPFVIIRAEDIVTLLIERNGDRTLYSRNAVVLTVGADFWYQGDKAIALIDQMVHKSLIVREDGAQPPAPQGPPPPPPGHRIELVL